MNSDQKRGYNQAIKDCIEVFEYNLGEEVIRDELTKLYK